MPTRNDRKGAISKARYLRANPSQPEADAWRFLRTLTAQRFRRQYPIGLYVLDFFSPRYRLCIEIDGPWHDEERDGIRDAWLEEQNIYTIRVDAEALGDFDALNDRIQEVCRWKRPRFAKGSSE